MTRALKTRLLINGAALLLLIFLYGGELADWLRAREAPVAAFLAPPEVGFAMLALGVGLATALVTLWGWRAGRDDTFRGYRLLPIAASILVFVDVFVLGANRSPYQSHEVVAAALSHLQERATYLGEAGRVPTSREQLEPILIELGQPPYLVRGRTLPAWILVVRTGCTAPSLDVEGLGPGTVIYCVSADETRAWITAVGLPWHQRFGEPAPVSSPAGVLRGLVEPAPSAAPGHGLDPLPPLRAPMEQAEPGR